MLYKPELAQKVSAFLNITGSDIPIHSLCCHHDPLLPQGTRIINVCAGCDKRFRSLYKGITTISLWEVLADSLDFPFPDYHGQRMSIHDACPTRTETRVHNAVRSLLSRMNISIVEPERTRTEAICCGDSFYGVLPTNEVKAQMKNRADQMPVENVVVYCVSCVKSMYIGGKRPRYLVDLLFAEPTTADVFNPDAWHHMLQTYIDTH